MLKKAVSYTLAVLLTSTVIFTGTSHITPVQTVYAAGKAADTQILRQLRRDNGDNSLTDGKIFLTKKPVQIKRYSSIKIGKIDKRFTRKNLEKVRGKVRLYPVEIYKGDIENRGGDPTTNDYLEAGNSTSAYQKKYGEDTITAMNPVKTAVRVIYTYHKPRKISTAIKKNGKRMTVIKTAYTGKTYKQIRLLEVISCPESHPGYIYGPGYKDSTENGTYVMSSRKYSQTNYVKLLMSMGQNIPAYKKKNDNSINKKNASDTDKNTAEPQNNSKGTAGTDTGDDDSRISDGNSRDIQSDDNDTEGTDSSMDDSRTEEEKFRVYLGSELYYKFFTYECITKEDYQKGIRLWKEQGCPDDKKAKSRIVDTIANDIKDRQEKERKIREQREAEIKENAEKNIAGQEAGNDHGADKTDNSGHTGTDGAYDDASYMQWRSDMLKTLGLTKEEHINMFDKYAETDKNSPNRRRLVMSKSADTIHAEMNNMFLPVLNNSLHRKLNDKSLNNSNSGKTRAYKKEYSKALDEYIRKNNITDFTESVDNKFDEIMADVVSRAEDADRLNPDSGYDTYEYESSDCTNYYGINKEVLESYKKTAGEGSDFRRYSRIFRRTQEEVSYGGSEYAKDGGVLKYDDPNNYCVNSDGSFHFTLLCGGWAALVAGISNYCGIPAEVIGNRDHAWVRVTLGGENYNSDPTLFHHSYDYGLYRQTVHEDKSDMPAGAWLIYNGEENCWGFEGV